VDKKTKKPTASDTIYLIASISKTFVMEQTVRAYREGKIASLDDEVRKYVPDFSVRNPFGVDHSTRRQSQFPRRQRGVAGETEIVNEHERPGKRTHQPTFRAMLSHLSGLSREAPCDDVFCRHIDTATILARLRQQSLISAPEMSPSYSNLGFALLGNLISERLYNETFEKTLLRMTRPLAMKWTGYNLTKEIAERMAVEYQVDGMNSSL
jgi:CubicO group peptidase (beta-lactamase class C family)